MALRFTKMHGAGNDYVYVDGVAQDLPADLSDLARRIADRHYGVGGDGLICILPPEPGVAAHVRMRMWNNDGSESEMCGNGVRCVAKFAYDRGLARANPLKVQTGRGVLSIDLGLGPDGTVASATVDMGEPILELERIPADPAQLRGARGGPLKAGGEVTLRDGGRWGNHPMTLVSMGNPHAVAFVDALDRAFLLGLGRDLESHKAFARKTNVHFVRVVSPREVRVLHWERGTGETLACGTGACAVCVAGVLTGRTGRDLLAHLPGGDLRLRWDEATNHVFMTGPAVEVFSGEWNG